ncbi:MAG: radical SAM protein [Syntrophales bacterium]|nr:radical SAM protein [Syntrophales bacterium]
MNFHDHPCFSDGARHKMGRIHLPVAPDCNMQCNYCNRDFECVNESRPGVSSTILRPRQAVDYLDEVLVRIKNIAVAGIAGPGDPFANAEETMETLQLVRERHPDLMLCVATNGLNVSDFVDELSDLNVSHVTLTINAVDPIIGEKIYAWARKNRKVYRREEAARIILESQREAIRRLKEKGITVKINSVIIPGINDGHIPEVARQMAAMKADIFNAIPMYHVASTPFAEIPPLPLRDLMELRREAGSHLPQMNHCSRCRADAAGMIGEAQSQEIMDLLRKASRPSRSPERPYVAVASMEGIFVNQHLGEATGLWIYGKEGERAALIDWRPAPPSGGGEDRWEEMSQLLRDCNTVLVGGIGPFPQAVLERSGVRVVVMEGLAREGMEAIFSGNPIPKILLRKAGSCGIGGQCRGSGTGCG